MRLSVLLFCWFLVRITVAQPIISPVQRAQRNAIIIQKGERLNLQEAIAIALEKNYQIRIARSQQQITINDRTPGNAGFLPVVTGSLNNNNSLQHLRQNYFNNTPAIDQPGIGSTNTSYGVNASWQIFNGFGTFVAFERLGHLVKISEVNTRANIEQTIATVATAYYDVIRQLEQLLSLRQALDISRDRLELARATYEVGTRSKVDFLSAQVDYNADSSALIAQEQVVDNAKILLNTVLVRDPLTEFAVNDSIIVRRDLSLDSLQESLLAKNPLLVAATLNRQVADANLRLTKAQQYPTVNLVAGYNYTTIANRGGNFGVRAANNNGLTYGLQASVPIFNGLNQKRLIQDAKINTIVSEYQEANQKNQLQLLVNQVYNQYKSNIRLANVEVQNYRIANENVDIAYDRYRVGFSTAVEFRDVQRNAIAARARLINAEFNAKAAEIELLRLSSLIVQAFEQ